MKAFTTPQRRRDEIRFELDGEEYRFVPSKMANVIMPIVDPHSDNGDEPGGGMLRMTQATWDWLRGVDPATGEPREGVGMPDEDYARIRARLDDSDDDLDIDTVSNIVRWLISQVSGRPTTSRRG